MKNSILIAFCLFLLFPLSSFGVETFTLGNGVLPPDHPMAIKYTKLITEAYKRAGYNVKVIKLPDARSIHQANEGKNDGLYLEAIGVLEKAPNLLPVGKPLSHLNANVYSIDKNFKFQGFKSLKDLKIGTLRGSSFVKMLETEAPKSSVYEVNSIEQGVKMLLQKRVDLVIGTTNQVALLLKKPAFKGKFFKVEPPVKVIGIYTYLHKKHADAAKKIGRAFDSMRSDGTYNKIMK